MSRPRPTRAVAIAALAALTLAACGDDDDPAPADTVTETMTETMSGTMTETMTETMSDTMTETTTDTMSETTTDTMTETMSDTMTETMSDTMTEAMSDEEAMADVPASQALAITDVDGATFTLHELAGTPVFVEAFATWCHECREQLGRTNEAAARLGDSAQVLALSVETDLSAADVAAYAEDQGFDHIRFAVMSPELLAALVDEFGNAIATPPSTPWFVLDAMGHPGELMTGGDSADGIVAAVEAVA